MPRAVRYDQYGPLDVLHIAEVDQPEPEAGHVVVEVVAAGINPGEIPVRQGAFHEQWPATFPSGQGSDLAGRVVSVGDGVDGFAIGDEVFGWSDTRSAQADYTSVPAGQLAAKPAELSWDVAGSLFVAGTTAYAAVQAVAPAAGETVLVSGAAGGVGSLAVQLARRAGATVIGLAGPHNQDWLASLGVTPVVYGDGQAERVRAAAPDGVDAAIDTFGGGYVDLAVELGVAPDRIDTIIDFAAAQKHPGVKTDGSQVAARPEVLAELAQAVAAGELVVPIAATYPLEQVREAYTALAERHTRGKIVLRVRP